MNATPPLSSSTDLAYRVDGFEEALAAEPATDLARFLPDDVHSNYGTILAELIRVDLEHSWRTPSPKRLNEYLNRFPILKRLPQQLNVVAFEEYRQQTLHGRAVQPDEYRRTYGVETGHWPEAMAESLVVEPTARVFLDDVPQGNPLATMKVEAAVMAADAEQAGSYLSDPEVVARWRKETEAMPEPGTEFLGFKLLRELGRGAFARVYLARQGELGSRYVALKIACNIVAESVTLAQLQHTNIVPIYSFHQSGSYQAVCMPYFGQTTLAQVLENLDGGRSIPNSGRQLRSTVNAQSLSRRPSTVMNTPSRDSDSSSVPGSKPKSDPPISTDEEPYLGLSPEGWAKLEGLSYVEAIFTLGVQLADGLAHAHARGILHRDLKPANILFTDEGRPMLLDFNLAEDVKTRGSAERAAIGGTLQYMAPEHMEAFRNAAGLLDARCDVYSLGVILYELLSGRHPFPIRKGHLRDKIPKMLSDRRQPPPSLRQHNDAVSPAANAIISKCLMPKPADRYQSAGDLREDLERHLRHQPLNHAANPSLRENLRKWFRRHPKLASSGSVAALAAGVILTIGISLWYTRDHSRNLTARTTYADHVAAFADAQLFLDDRHQALADLDKADMKLRGVLDRYAIPDNPGDDRWKSTANLERLSPPDRERLFGDLGEAYYLLAQVEFLKAVSTKAAVERGPRLQQAREYNAAASALAGGRLPRAIAEQRASLAELDGQVKEAADLREAAAKVKLDSPRDLFLYGMLLNQKGRHREAVGHLQRSTVLEPRNFSAWFVRGTSHMALSQPEQAAMCFGACLAIRDDFGPAWLNRGLAFQAMGLDEQAIDDFDRVVKWEPQNPAGYLHRAASRISLNDLAGAERDYGLALATGYATARVSFLRAAIRQQRGDAAGAASDRAEGFRSIPQDDLSWLARAEARSEKDPEAALADTEEALKVNPRRIEAIQMKAHLLGERLNKPEGAMATLNRGLELHPEYVPLLAGRGVQLARESKRTDALRDAKAAWRLDQTPANAYQVACIYALTSRANLEDKEEAFRLLWWALKTGYGLESVDSDADLDPIRNDPEYNKLVADAKAIQASRNK